MKDNYRIIRLQWVTLGVVILSGVLSYWYVQRFEAEAHKGLADVAQIDASIKIIELEVKGIKEQLQIQMVFLKSRIYH